MIPVFRHQQSSNFTNEEVKLSRSFEDEILEILLDIADKFPKILHNHRDLPIIIWKKGGSGARTDGETYIKLRLNVWKNLSTGGRKFLLVHEAIHFAKVKHSSVNKYSFQDFASIALYKRIWGDDEDYDQAMKEAEDFIDLIIK